MAKAKLNKAEITNLAAARDALSLAVKLLDKQCGKHKLPEGSYAADVSVSVTGDVCVGAASEPGEACSVSAGDLAAAMLGGMTADDRADAMARAVKLIANAEDGKAASVKKLDTGKTAVKAAIDVAREKGLVKPTAARAGAVTGKPTARIAGTVNANKLEVELAA